MVTGTYKKLFRCIIIPKIQVTLDSKTTLPTVPKQAIYKTPIWLFFSAKDRSRALGKKTGWELLQSLPPQVNPYMVTPSLTTVALIKQRRGQTYLTLIRY